MHNNKSSIDYVMMPPRAETPDPNSVHHLHQHLTAFLCSMARRDRGIRTPTSVTGPSAQPAPVQPLDPSEEDALPRVPRQHPVDQPSSTPHDLTRHRDERRAVRRELHPQQGPFLRLVLRFVPRGYG